MKKTVAITILVCCVMASKAQPGKFASNQKGLIDTKYRDSKNIAGLSGWTFVQGSVISPMSDPIAVTVDIFKKGTSFLVFFSKCVDSTCTEYAILDVLEITVTKGWTVKAAFCLQSDVETPTIVALAKQTRTEYLKTIKKAWQFNFETNQVEQIAITAIACPNEEFDID